MNSGNITVIVNSCDSYSDIWEAFFSLLKKYWKPFNYKIILNTETKSFSYDGLDIECIHPNNPNAPYGERMLNVLGKVKTKYIIPIMDDFFIRKPVDVDEIDRIIGYMEKNKKIASFYAVNIKDLEDNNPGKYPGYERKYNGDHMCLNMQAGIWNTKKYKKYWRKNVSPWEWEVYSNFITAYTNDEFYYAIDNEKSFIYYGVTQLGLPFSIVRGKWYLPDVVPFFEQEKIEIDLSIRGEYTGTMVRGGESTEIIENKKRVRLIPRVLPNAIGKRVYIPFAIFVKRNTVLRHLGIDPENMFCMSLFDKKLKKYYKEKEKIERKKKIAQSGGVLWYALAKLSKK